MFGEMSLVWMLVGAGGLCVGAELLVRWVRRADEREIASSTSVVTVEQQRAGFETDLRNALDCLDDALIDLAARSGVERRLTWFGDLCLYAHNGNRAGFDIERAKRELSELAAEHGFDCSFEGVNSLDLALIVERHEPTLVSVAAT